MLTFMADAAGLLQIVIDLLDANPLFKQAVQKKFSHILMDNIQNLSEIQFKFFRTIVGTQERTRGEAEGLRKIVSVFGDDDQAIFGFKPSKSDIFQDMASTLPEAVVRNLPQSFRVKSQPLLDSLRKLISQGKKRLETQSIQFSKALKALEPEASVFDDHEVAYYGSGGREETDEAAVEKITISSHQSEAAEDEALAAEIQRLLRVRNPARAHVEEGDEHFEEDTEDQLSVRRGKLPSICVIVKTKKLASDYYRFLRSKGLPVTVNTIQLRESPEIKFMMNFLLALIQPTASDSLYELIAASTGPYSVSPKALGRLTEFQLKTQQPLRKLLDEFSRNSAADKQEQQAKRKVDRLLEDLDHFERQMKTRTTSQILYGILKKTQLLQAARNPNSTEDEDVARHVTAFLRICSDLETKMSISRVVDVLPALQHVLDRTASLSPGAYGATSTRTSGEVVSQEEEPGFIKVGTPWSAAGSEFDYVFVPRCTEDFWPGAVSKDQLALYVSTLVAASKGKPTPNSSPVEVVDEQRRLFYVSLSRARNHVKLSYSASRANGHLSKPSRFLTETISNTESVDVSELRLAERTAAALRVMQSRASSGNIADESSARDSSGSARNLFGQTSQQMVVQHAPVSQLEFSKLSSSFLRCPMQYYLENIVKLPFPPPSPYQAFQVSLHAAREWLSRRRADGKSPEVEGASLAFANSWYAEVRKPSGSPIPPEIWECGMTIIEGWVDMDIDIGLRAVDVPFSVDLSNIHFTPSENPDLVNSKPVPIAGSIPRIYNDGRVRIFLSCPAETAPRTPAELMDVAKVTALLHSTSSGRAHVVTIESINKNFGLQITDYRPTQDDLNLLAPNLAAVSALVASGVFRAHSSKTKCSRCAFKTSCPSSSSKAAARAAVRPK